MIEYKYIIIEDNSYFLLTSKILRSEGYVNGIIDFVAESEYKNNTIGNILKTKFYDGTGKIVKTEEYENEQQLRVMY